MGGRDVRERLVRELPPDGVRLLLSRVEQLRALRRSGKVARLELDASGRLIVLVECDWREEPKGKE